MKQLHDLFDPQQLKAIQEAPPVAGKRHPTWYPLYAEKLRTTDFLVHRAVTLISQQPTGDAWLRRNKKELLDQADYNNASSALAEIRAYGGFLEAGFDVTPIPRRDQATPDFTVKIGDKLTTVEVFSKHQDKEQEQLLNAIHSTDLPLPADVTRQTRTVGTRSSTITTAPLTPGGKPDPKKIHDSVQTNLISRICGIKSNEKQIPADRPALLVIDLAHFGGPVISQFFGPNETTPVLSGHQGITSGPIWYAMYGWKGAPVFQEGRHDIVRMEHDGRFRVDGEQKSKLSAVLVVFDKGAVLLENPRASQPLTQGTRVMLCRYPWFVLARSICEWQLGDVHRQVGIHQNMIGAMEQSFDRLQR